MVKIKNEKELAKKMTCDELCFTEKKKKKSEAVENEMHDKGCSCDCEECGDDEN